MTADLKIIEKSADFAPIEAAKPSQMQVSRVQVRSKISEEIYEILKPRLPEIINEMVESALGESLHTPKKDIAAATYITNNRRMVLDMMKIVSRDVEVSGAKGGLSTWLEQTGEMTKEELEAIRKRCLDLGAKDKT